MIRGELLRSPAPRTAHQIVIGESYAILRAVAGRSGGLAIVSPADVVLSESTILQPDLLYVAKQRRHLVGDRVHGPPDLVVEILSQGSERRDRVAKLDAYARYSVPEFWIVDYRAQVIDFLILDDGRYVVMQTAAGRYQSPRLAELSIDLPAFWNEVDQRMPPL